MKRLVLANGIVLGLFLVASPLVAQSGDTDPMITMQPTLDMEQTKSFSSRLKGVFRREAPTLSEAEISRAAVADFSGCHYDGLKTGARKVLAVGQGSELAKRVRAYVNGQCWLRGSFGFRPSNFQQALFAHAYRGEFRQSTAIISEKPIDYAGLVKLAAPAQAQRYQALMALADCTARANPKAAHALVIADVTTPSESAAFGEIMPALSGCTDTGRALALNKEVIKGSLAEVLYRNARLASGAGGRD